ncbi:UPF0716 protein FxsA [Geodermatophilus bullaregiensis]|uniref:FxsA family protein n=1 Tax=Geodermatophilus bullaregiensis TaxID=1564160 RepID=UPI0019597606|nr:FxsA family protein [Geodermatophilus bullaregiensis]MBM7804295.1 UPF0716 protein FxsA [Geodermatophilus bullaregiensis]
MGHRVRVLAGLWALAEVVVVILVAAWIGVGWTLLAALATTVLGWVLLARQLKGLAALRPAPARGGSLRRGRTVGDAGLVAAGGALMVLPGFLGDVVGLLCLLPPTRPLVRAAVTRGLSAGLAARLGVAGPVRVRSTRVPGSPRASGATSTRVIEGEVAGEVLDAQPGHAARP